MTTSPLKFEDIVMPVPEGLAGKFANLHDALRGELVEMDDEIHGTILALVTAGTILMLGEPGNAKSYLGIRLFVRISGMNYFHTLLDSFSGPDDVYGPLDLLKLKTTGARIRRTKSYLPTADVANIEEIFNAGPSILRSLHMITYERKFNEDGVLITVPLKVMYCSTNDLPRGGGLRAFRDRIVQTYKVTAPQERANIVHMLKHKPVEVPEPVLAWKDVLAAQAEVQQIHIPDSILGTLADIQRQLDAENMAPSPRRLVMCTDLLRGEAWLEGCDAVSSDHLPALVPALWSTPDQISKVEEVVMERANPLEREARKLLVDIDEIGVLTETAVGEKDPTRQGQVGREAYLKCQRAHVAYTDLLEKVGGSRRQLAILEEAKGRIFSHSTTLLADVFHAEPGTIKLPGQP